MNSSDEIAKYFGGGGYAYCAELFSLRMHPLDSLRETCVPLSHARSIYGWEKYRGIGWLCSGCRRRLGFI